MVKRHQWETEYAIKAPTGEQFMLQKVLKRISHIVCVTKATSGNIIYCIGYPKEAAYIAKDMPNEQYSNQRVINGNSK